MKLAAKPIAWSVVVGFIKFAQAAELGSGLLLERWEKPLTLLRWMVSGSEWER